MTIESLLPISPLQLDRKVAKPPFVEALQHIHDTEVIGTMLLGEIDRITADIWPGQPIRWKSQTTNDLTQLHDACMKHAWREFQSKANDRLYRPKPNEGILFDAEIFYFLRQKQMEEIIHQPIGFGNLVHCALSNGCSYTPFTTEWYVLEHKRHKQLGVVQIQHPDIDDIRPVRKVRQAMFSIIGDHIEHSITSFTERTSPELRSDALRTATMYWD